MAQIAARVSDEEKEKILAYCEERGMNITGLIKIALKQYFERQEGR